MQSSFDLERALKDLGRRFNGWHRCGRLVSQFKCPHCGVVTPEECLLLDSPWLTHIPTIWTTLDSASRSGFTRERVKAALEDAIAERRERHR